MPTTTATDTAALVRAGYDAFGRGDLAALGELFHPDATWNHRNGGRFHGVKRGFDAIAAFFGESVQLTGGSLSAQAERFLADSERVAVLVHMSGRRPDGRALDDRQVRVFTVLDGRATSVEQYVGDPAAVEAFWA